MSFVNSASARASASGPFMSHLRSGDSSQTLHAWRVAWCSATASPKSAAHAQPSQSVQLAPASRWTSSNAVRCSSVVDTPCHLALDEFVYGARNSYHRRAVVHRLCRQLRAPAGAAYDGPGMAEARPKRPSLVDSAEQALRDWLAPGRHRTGDRLPPEHELGAMLGVSRGTLRTALQRLESS